MSCRAKRGFATSPSDVEVPCRNGLKRSETVPVSTCVCVCVSERRSRRAGEASTWRTIFYRRFPFTSWAQPQLLKLTLNIHHHIPPSTTNICSLYLESTRNSYLGAWGSSHPVFVHDWSCPVGTGSVRSWQENPLPR